MSEGFLNRETYREMFEVGKKYEQRLRDLASSPLEIDYESPPKDIEELNDSGLVEYRRIPGENNMEVQARINNCGRAVLGEEILEEQADNKEEFADKMLEVDLKAAEKYE